MPLQSFADRLSDSKDLTVTGILKTEVYPVLFPCYVGMADIDDLTIQRTGRDVSIAVKKPGGGCVVETIEEKIRGPKYFNQADILVELYSNMERETAGWGVTSEADWLVYVWQDLPRMRVLILPLPDLRKWFILTQGRYQSVCSKTPTPGGCYTTVNKIVPWGDERFRAFRLAHGYFLKKRNAEGQWL